MSFTDMSASVRGKSVGMSLSGCGGSSAIGELGVEATESVAKWCRVDANVGGSLFSVEVFVFRFFLRCVARS
jgi:hypothetical protein